MTEAAHSSQSLRFTTFTETYPSRQTWRHVHHVADLLRGVLFQLPLPLPPAHTHTPTGSN